MSAAGRDRRSAARMLDLARSPRVAAWGTGLAAVAVLVTVVAGAVETGVDTSRVAGVTLVKGPAPVACREDRCTVTWTVRVADGPVYLQRVTLPGLGEGGPEDGPGLQSVTLDATTLEPVPATDDALERTDALLRPARVLDGGARSTLVVSVVVPDRCPADGAPTVQGGITVLSGGAVAQHEGAPQQLPCSA